MQVQRSLKRGVRVIKPDGTRMKIVEKEPVYSELCGQRFVKYRRTLVPEQSTETRAPADELGVRFKHA
jgi:hypothetical protein